MEKASPARRAAWEVLAAYLVAEPQRARLGTSKRPFPPKGLSARDRAFARKLAEGTVKRLLSLDAVLLALTGGKKTRPPALRAALLLGAYQCIFEPQIAKHAVVNEAVDLAKAAAGQGGAGFANALMRRLAERSRLEDWLPRPSSEATALELARFHSYPELLVARWLDEHGQEKTEHLLELGNMNPQLTLRTNRVKGDRTSVTEALAKEGIVTRPGLHPLSLLLATGKQEKERMGSLLDTQAFSDGLFSIQDSSQTEILDLVEPEEGMRILDLCAAPGGKTTGLAEASQNKAQILAYDKNAEKLALLPKELDRLGLSGVLLLEDQQALLAAVSEAPVDCVLVDAPCSNTGVLARRPEARWRFSMKKLVEHVRLQEELVLQAASYLRIGGRLVYSTCSIEACENEDMAQMVADLAGLRLISTERALPRQGLCDGGGNAVFSRTETMNPPPEKTSPKETSQ